MLKVETAESFQVSVLSPLCDLVKKELREERYVHSQGQNGGKN